MQVKRSMAKNAIQKTPRPKKTGRLRHSGLQYRTTTESQNLKDNTYNLFGEGSGEEEQATACSKMKDECHSYKCLQCYGDRVYRRILRLEILVNITEIVNLYRS